MQQITLSLRTVTPLFLAGANQASAELRAPSFRGVMRYWNRALLAGLVGTNAAGLTTLTDLETHLFGATDRGSSITLRISPPSQAAKEFTEPISRRIHDRWQATGKGYLLWSMAKSGKAEKGNLKAARWYFPPGTTLRVTLAARHGHEAQLRQALGSLWLLTHLGGIGSRARRCAGSLMAQETEGTTFELPFTQAKDAQALKIQLERGIQFVRTFYSHEQPVTPPQQASFDTLARGVCRIWILQDEQPWTSYEEAMQRLGEKLQDYRSDIPLERRRIFGLPLPPRYLRERRASPLLLRVTELQGKKYVGVAVLFKTEGNSIRMSDYTTIERWIDRFQGKLEVAL